MGASDAQTCLGDVVTQAPATTAALRAQMLLDLIDTGRLLSVEGRAPGATDVDTPEIEPAASAHADDTAVSADDASHLFGDLPISFNLTVGRLELSAAGGIFGVWNGVAGGIVMQSFLADTDFNPGFIILGAGAISAAMGAAYAAGGFLLADASVLGSNAGRLVTTGMAVGTAMGIAGAFAAADILEPTKIRPNLITATTVSTTVLGGYLGGAAGGAAAYFLDLDAGQVSMINSGAALGAFNGLMLIPNLNAVYAPIWGSSLAFVLSTAVGVGGGYALSEVLEFTWIEALICGGGAVLGVLALTPATSAAGPFLGVPYQGLAASLWYTAPAMVGSTGGFAIAAAAFAAWRYYNGEPVIKEKWLSVKPVMGQVLTVLDKDGNPATIAPLVALEF